MTVRVNKRNNGNSDYSSMESYTPSYLSNNLFGAPTWDFDPSNRSNSSSSIPAGTGIGTGTVAAGADTGTVDWRGVFGSDKDIFGRDSSNITQKVDPKIDPNKWDNNFGNYMDAGKFGLGAVNTFLAWEAGDIAKENLKIQKEQMAKNEKITLAAAQMGLANKGALLAANAGMSGGAARAQAEAGSAEAMRRYGLTPNVG